MSEPALQRLRPGATVVVAGVVAFAGVVGLAGCSLAGSTPPSRTPTAASTAPSARSTPSLPTSPSGASVTDPEATLKMQAEAMRALVLRLIADVPVTDWAPSADGDNSCAVGTGERWPRQWSYAQRSVTVKDAKAHADRIVATLAAQGWSVTPAPASDGQETRQLQRDAVLVVVASVASSGILDVEATSPCVQADGTLDTRPII